MQIHIVVQCFEIIDQVSPVVTHPELVKAIWNVVEEDGSVKDNAVSVWSHIPGLPT
jgi:hypothetical protein